MHAASKASLSAPDFTFALGHRRHIVQRPGGRASRAKAHKVHARPSTLAAEPPAAQDFQPPMLTLDQNYLRRLVESSPDIVIAVDRDGTIIYYNDGARKNLRYTSAEIIGRKVTAVYPSLEEARRVMNALRQSPDGDRIANFETVLRDKDNQQIPVAI